MLKYSAYLAYANNHNTTTATSIAIPCTTRSFLHCLSLHQLLYLLTFSELIQSLGAYHPKYAAKYITYFWWALVISHLVSWFGIWITSFATIWPRSRLPSDGQRPFYWKVRQMCDFLRWDLLKYRSGHSWWHAFTVCLDCMALCGTEGPQALGTFYLLQAITCAWYSWLGFHSSNPSLDL